MPQPFLTKPTQVPLNQLLAFLNCTSKQKSLFNPSIHSWDKSNQTGHTHFSACPHKKFFDQLLIYVNLYQNAKNQAINFFWRYGWLKYDKIWLAENILGHISETKIFPNMGFVQKHIKYYKISLWKNLVKINYQIFQ